MADGSLWEGLQQPVPAQRGLWDGLYDPMTGMPYPGNAPDYGDLSQRAGGMAQVLAPSPDTIARIGNASRRMTNGEFYGGLAQGLYEAGAMPGRAFGTVPGGPPTPEEEANWGAGTALGMLGAGRIPGGAPPGAIGTFAGRSAKTADLSKLAQAEDMLARGVSGGEITSATGWFQGADGKWRFEIPDQLSHWNVNPQALRPTDLPMKMEDAFSHPELMKAYPQLYNVDLNVGPLGNMTKGTYTSGMGVDVPTISLSPASPATMRSTNLHELQHGIQDIEGFATGGSAYGGLRPGTPEWKIYQDTLQRIRTPTPKAELEKSGVLGPEYSYEDYLREHQQNIKNDKLGLDRMAQETAVREGYRRSAGEVEARNVQRRADFTPEELQGIQPIATEDILRGNQIVKFRPPGFATGSMWDSLFPQ